jgi:hypothetical protein
LENGGMMISILAVIFILAMFLVVVETVREERTLEKDIHEIIQATNRVYDKIQEFKDKA